MHDHQTQTFKSTMSHHAWLHRVQIALLLVVTDPPLVVGNEIASIAAGLGIDHDDIDTAANALVGLGFIDREGDRLYPRPTHATGAP